MQELGAKFDIVDIPDDLKAQVRITGSRQPARCRKLALSPAHLRVSP